MKENIVLVPEDGEDIILLLNNIKEFVEETSVSHPNAYTIRGLCQDIIEKTRVFNDFVDEVGLVEEDYFKVMEKVAFLQK